MTDNSHSPIFFLTRAIASLGLSAGTIVMTIIAIGMIVAAESFWLKASFLLGLVWAHAEYMHLIYRKRDTIYRGVFRTLAVIEIITKWLFRFCVDQHVLIVEWDEDQDEVVLPSIMEMFTEHDEDFFVNVRTVKYQIRLHKD